MLSAEEKDQQPTLSESSSHELESELLTDSLSQSLVLAMVSGEIAWGGVRGVGDVTSLVWGHAMSYEQSYPWFSVVGIGG